VITGGGGDIGAAYGASSEWTTGATSGAGVPQNVLVSNSGTSLNFGSSTACGVAQT